MPAATNPRPRHQADRLAHDRITAPRRATKRPFEHMDDGNIARPEAAARGRHRFDRYDLAHREFAGIRRPAVLADGCGSVVLDVYTIDADRRETGDDAHDAHRLIAGEVDAGTADATAPAVARRASGTADTARCLGRGTCSAHASWAGRLCSCATQSALPLSLQAGSAARRRAADAGATNAALAPLARRAPGSAHAAAHGRHARVAAVEFRIQTGRRGEHQSGLHEKEACQQAESHVHQPRSGPSAVEAWK